MASSKAKHSSKALAQSKRARRQWLTFLRMVRYGVNNFSRNAWLTVAATVVMTITLLIIFVTVSARQVLNDSVTELQKKVDMSIYLKNDTPDSEANKIADNLRQLSNVEEVTYINPRQARDAFAEEHKNDPKSLEALNNADNSFFFGTLRIGLKNINDTSQLQSFVNTNERVKKYLNAERKPSFAGTRQKAIKTLASSTEFAQRIGIGASIVFIAISSLIVFNTIRMAIFNRKDEIEMMKLIGANKGFIRGPFVIEAMVYGVVAGLLAAGLGLLVLNLAKPGLLQSGVAVQPTIDFVTTYFPIVIVGMVVLGALIGAVSSLLATRRYLKI